MNFDVEMNECRNEFSMQSFTLTPSKAWQGVRGCRLPTIPNLRAFLATADCFAGFWLNFPLKHHVFLETF